MTARKPGGEFVHDVIYNSTIWGSYNDEMLKGFYKQQSDNRVD